jgi:hypothetical protein
MVWTRASGPPRGKRMRTTLTTHRDHIDRKLGFLFHFDREHRGASFCGPSPLLSLPLTSPSKATRWGHSVPCVCYRLAICKAQTLHNGDARKEPPTTGRNHHRMVVQEKFPPRKGIQGWQRQIGVCARTANGGKLNRRQGLATTRWVCAPKKTSSPSACASRAPVGATTTLPGNRCVRQVRVPLLRPRSHNDRRRPFGWRSPTRDACGE